jgi:alpha-glucuronidase
MYESLETCPDDLLLFMHHVPYTNQLHSGKTVIQHIYDSHYQGESDAEQLVEKWKSLKGLVDEQRYEDVLRRLEYQACHSQVWRDAVCSWFLTTSGIPDEKGRAGHFPNRIEAEDMKLEGYEVFGVKPWEAASGGKAVRCVSTNTPGSVSFKYAGKAGNFNVRVEYFDQNSGVSHFKFFVAERLVDQWAADDKLPSREADAHTSTCRRILGVTLQPGDEIKIEGQPQGHERACLDYIEIEP